MPDNQTSEMHGPTVTLPITDLLSLIALGAIVGAGLVMVCGNNAWIKIVALTLTVTATWIIGKSLVKYVERRVITNV